MEHLKNDFKKGMEHATIALQYFQNCNSSSFEFKKQSIKFAKRLKKMEKRGIKDMFTYPSQESTESL